MSVSVLGVSEIGFRLPSIIFAVLWMLALYRFCQRHADRRTAQVAALVMGLSLAVGFIAKAAISDALLNLFIALSMFGIYDLFCAERDGRPTRRLLYYTYAMLGVGFMTKGPVAVFFPLLVSGQFFVSAGGWRAWLRAVFFWPGWLLFLAIVVPWHVADHLAAGLNVWFSNEAEARAVLGEAVTLLKFRNQVLFDGAQAELITAQAAA